MTKIIILAGSNNNNLKLAQVFAESLSLRNISYELLDLTQINLPVYSPIEEKNGAPDIIHQYVQKLEQCHAMIFTAPEYNGGIPPVVNNFIAWISRSGDKDWRKCFNGKHAIIGSHSGSGGLHALGALRMQLSYLGMNVLGRQVQVNSSKPLNQETIDSTIELLSKYIVN